MFYKYVCIFIYIYSMLCFKEQEESVILDYFLVMDNEMCVMIDVRLGVGRCDMI